MGSAEQVLMCLGAQRYDYTIGNKWESRSVQRGSDVSWWVQAAERVRLERSTGGGGHAGGPDAERALDPRQHMGGHAGRAGGSLGRRGLPRVRCLHHNSTHHKLLLQSHRA